LRRLTVPAHVPSLDFSHSKAKGQAAGSRHACEVFGVASTAHRPELRWEGEPPIHHRLAAELPSRDVAVLQPKSGWTPGGHEQAASGLSARASPLDRSRIMGRTGCGRGRCPGQAGRGPATGRGRRDPSTFATGYRPAAGSWPRLACTGKGGGTPPIHPGPERALRRAPASKRLGLTEPLAKGTWPGS